MAYRVYWGVALGILGLLGLAMFWVNSMRYFPQVNMSLPDNGELVFIGLPWASRGKCEAANQLIINALRQNCAACKIEGQCRPEMDAPGIAALSGQATGEYVVHSGSMRIVVRAGNASKPTCETIAEQITRDKKQAARCIAKLENQPPQK